ncbi:hypothetical protein HDU93_002431 [Gonapodya sp. JEL0774]|nr:hypothetical protein HDU93_002431 [Gonapodya sp. JEL0774]
MLTSGLIGDVLREVGRGVFGGAMVDFEEVFGYLDQAIRLDPNDPRAYVLRVESIYSLREAQIAEVRTPQAGE